MSAALLALETSGDACSAALATAAGVALRLESAPRRHAARLLGQVDELLREAGLAVAELDAVAFGRGPGAFTGARIAAAAAHGLAAARALPLLPVSSLAALAWEARRRHGGARVLAARDARLDQVYWGLYRCDGEAVEALRPDAVAAAGDFAAALDALPDGWLGAGSGFRLPAVAAAAGRLGRPVDPDARPDARAVAALGLADLRAGRVPAVDDAQPLYLRAPAAPPA